MRFARELARHKLRNGLTIGGIVIGVMALVAMGALAEKTDLLLEGGVRYYGDHVSVVGPGLMRVGKGEELARVEGVAAVFPLISVSARQIQTAQVNLSPPPSIVATKPGYSAYSRSIPSYSQGRGLSGRAGEVVLGPDLAKELGAAVGSRVLLPQPPPERRGEVRPSYEFEVVGIFEKALTVTDTIASITFEDGQRLLKDSLSPAVREVIDASSVVSAFDVFGTEGTDLDELARRINASVRDVRAYPPSEIVSAFRSGAAIFAAVTTGSALLALVVGGLSIINTMSMAVVERFREIGVRKAVGARRSQIMREFLMESAAFGAIGGAIGICAGWLVTVVINALTADQNLSLFVVTPRLIAGAALFSVALGALAGVVPAMRAARLHPAVALRYE